MTARDDTSSASRSVVRSVVEQSRPAPRPVPSVTAADIERAIGAFSREVIRAGRWRVHVPGKHSSSGIAYDALLEVLASQGRDVLANTVQLAQFVTSRMRSTLSRSRRMPTIDLLREAAEPALLEHVEKRMERGNGDMLFTALTREYAARKRAQGRGSQPITVASGETRSALSRSAYVEWL